MTADLLQGATLETLCQWWCWLHRSVSPTHMPVAVLPPEGVTDDMIKQRVPMKRLLWYWNTEFRRDPGRMSQEEFRDWWKNKSGYKAAAMEDMEELVGECCG